MLEKTYDSASIEPRIANKWEDADAFAAGANGEPKVYLEGEDVTSEIRSDEVSQLASQVAAFPRVRSALFDRQRAFAKAPGLVADGRDMGTVVFPDADVKVAQRSYDAFCRARDAEIVRRAAASAKARELREYLSKHGK